MADNVNVTSGVGITVATDQLAGGEHVQKVKLIDGTADSGTAIPGDAANGLDVDVTRLPYDVAHDSPDAGNPVKIGARARNTYINQVAENDRVDLVADLLGRLRVVTSDSDRQPISINFYQTGIHTISQNGDGPPTSARWAIFNPSSFVNVRFRRIFFESQLGSALAATSSPSLVLQRFSYVPGTFGGGDVTPCKRKTLGNNGTAQVKANPTFTGGTFTLLGVAKRFLPVAAATAVGYNPPNTQDLELHGEDVIELAQNEGLIFYQGENGQASDTRRYLTTFILEEYFA